MSRARNARRFSESEPVTDWKSVIIIAVLLAVLLIALLVTQAKAFDQVTPGQHGRSWNQIAFSGTNAAVSITVTPTPSQRAYLYGFAAFCSGGSASMSITNGGSFSKGWVSSSTLVGTTSAGAAWTPTPFTTDLGAALVVTLGACGGGNTGTLMIQADTF